MPRHSGLAESPREREAASASEAPEPSAEIARSLLGRHLILEVYGCPSKDLDDTDTIRNLLLNAARGAGATVIDSMFHHFTPQGVSGVVVIAESHLTIHTWPELGCATLDMFSCSPLIDLEKIGEYLANGLHASRFDTRVLDRGRIPHSVP